MSPSPFPRLLAALAAAASAFACGGASPSGRAVTAEAGRVGEEPISHVHLVENHSSSLTAWRRAGVRDRVLVHIDGHADLDWLPDETVARIAAARVEDLPNLELHPYAMDGATLSKFGIWNFVYPAARLGLVREMFWVVPDGTLREPDGPAGVVRDVLAGKLHMMSLDEAKGLRYDGKSIRGTVIGVPLTVCELANLPEIDEPVLLDIDLDFFTTRSAVTQEVLERPWIDPADVLGSLRRRGLRADIATLSLSTIGGYLPPENRWLGTSLQDALRAPGAAASSALADRTAAHALAASAGPEGALERWASIVERAPDDPTAWYGLARATGAAGRLVDSRRAMGRAIALDPLLASAALFEADRLWMNGAWPAALDAYRGFLAASPTSPFAPYARRREAGCLMRLDRNAEAIEAFRKVVAVAPRHGDTRLDLGVLLREGGALDEAVAQLREARAILPDLATYAAALGATYLQMGRTQEGIVELRAAVARRPTWALAQANLAAALADAGGWDEAREHIGLALALQPANPQYLRLGEVIRRRAAPR